MNRPGQLDGPATQCCFPGCHARPLLNGGCAKHWDWDKPVGKPRSAPTREEQIKHEEYMMSRHPDTNFRSRFMR